MGAGQPPIFDNPEDLEKKVEEYFKDRKNSGKPPLLESLAYFLGFASRQSLHDYAKKDEFSYIIERAKLKVFSEQMEGGILGDFNAQLVKLNATSNHGYSDAQKTDHTTDGEKITGIQISLIDEPSD